MRHAELVLTILAMSASLCFAADPADFVVTDIQKLPNDKYAQAVRQGRMLMEQTYRFLGPEAPAGKRFAGSNIACTNCHLNSGTRKFSNAWVGSYVAYPQYRSREDAVSTIEERINGCMERSVNGRALPVESDEMKAMVAYLHFLSRGIPVGAKLDGAGAISLKLLDRPADPAAGKKIYAQFCAACHGAEGQGMRRGAAGDAQGYQFPPLWGPDSYNDGAGMARIITAASFIRANMPLGTTYAKPVLSEAQAFDVAAFIDSQPRPARTNLEADFPARTNKPVDAAYPPYTPGFSAEQHKYGPWKPILDARAKGIFPPK